MIFFFSFCLSLNGRRASFFFGVDLVWFQTSLTREKISIAGDNSRDLRLNLEAEKKKKLHATYINMIALET